jgi:transposase
MERKIYPSDISREQFEPIRWMLEGWRHQTCPREVDLYDIFCAILYLLKNGCPWRAIPGDFPGWTTVRYYFDQWSQASTEEGSSLLERALKKSGAARARGQWTPGKDHVLHSGRAKREEHGHGAGERLLH